MAPKTVDLIAPGPPTSDPYAPAAPAWALARGFAARGDSVRVVHPAGADAAPAPAGVLTAAFPAVPRHVGSVRGDAEIARTARRNLRPGVELVVRDPLRPGALGLGADSSSVVALVRELSVAAFDPGARPGPAGGVGARFSRWRERALVRRLERGAIDEAGRVFCEAPELGHRLEQEYGFASGRIGQLARPVALADPVPSRTDARLKVGVPPDDPLVVALAGSERPDDPGFSRAREAFRRIRPLFAGAHLVLAGAPAPPANATHVLPGRDIDTLTTAVVAADVAVFAGGGTGFDPGVVLALRAGVACVVSPALSLPDGAASVVRRLPDDEPGSLASVLAELVADPSARRELASGGTAYASRFEPERVAATLVGGS